MVTRVVPLTTARPIVDEDGSQALELRQWTQAITDQAIIIGTGSPEGVVEAPQTASYMDDAGTAGSILYIKRDADDGAGNQAFGWILV